MPAILISVPCTESLPSISMPHMTDDTLEICGESGLPIPRTSDLVKWDSSWFMCLT